MTAAPYVYAATVVRVHDADTLTADIDLGFRTVRVGQTLRLLGCNARELAQPGGPEARDYLASLIPPGTVVMLRTVKVDKFGSRYDAAVTLPNGRDLVDLLITQQWAIAWNGQGPKPVPAWPRTVV